MHCRAAPPSRALASIVLATALAAPGCASMTRAVGLGPAYGPNEIRKGDTPEVVYAKAQRLFADQQWKEAGDAFGTLWKDFPKSDLASDAQFYEAESRCGQEKWNGAFELFKRYLKDWPLSPHAPYIQQRIYGIGAYTIEAGQHGFLGIFDYAGEGVDEFDYLVSAFPHGDLADDALIYVADYEWRTRQTKEAIGHLHDLVDDYPTSKWALEARLRLAKAYRDVNRGTRYDADSLQRSVAEYKTYVERVTADRARAAEYAPQLETARAELAEVEEMLARKHVDASDFYLNAGNVEAAQAELKNVIRDFPKSQAADEARRRLGVETPADQGGGK